MRVGIDIRCLAEGRRTGVEEYTLNLLKNLLKLDKKNKYVLFFNSWKAPRINFGWLEKYPNAALKKFRLPNKLLNFLFWYFNWPKIDKMIGGADLYFMPNIIFGSVSKKIKLIVTMHDLSFEKYPETFSLKKRLWHAFVSPKKICRRADLIIAVSESTKSDLAINYGIDSLKLAAIKSGLSGDFKVISRNDQKLLEIKEKYNLPYKFILYLGTVEPRKNIIGIIRAYNQLRKINDAGLNKYKLVIAGTSGWKNKKIFDEINKSTFASDIFLPGFIEDEDKPYAYNLASLFVSPSFFEGFGFPPLEAMASGVPVIVSNNSSLPEIVGNAGILIDPDKPDEIFQAIKEVLLNRELREKLREKGLEQAKKFSWLKTAKEFLEIIGKL